MTSVKINRSMPVVLLCGGEGTRFQEQTRHHPKPLVRIGAFPLVWHVMSIYRSYGFKNFILCLGYKGHMIKEYFLNYEVRKQDFTFSMDSGVQVFHNDRPDIDWKITFAETGAKTMTGGRLKRIEKYVRSDHFMVTYADGLANINLDELIRYHMSHDKIGTVTGVKALSQFGQLAVEGDAVKEFAEKPKITSTINGGFFVFHRKFFDFLEDSEDCILEREPMEKLTSADELRVYRHDGFWQCMDTFKDYQFLNELCEDNDRPPWKILK